MRIDADSSSFVNQTKPFFLRQFRLTTQNLLPSAIPHKRRDKNALPSATPHKYQLNRIGINENAPRSEAPDGSGPGCVNFRNEFN